MKAIIFSIIALFGMSAYAGNQQHINLDNIAGEIVAAEALCPEGMVCVTNGTVLTIRFVVPSSCYGVNIVETRTVGDVVEIEAVRVSPPPHHKMMCLTVMMPIEEQVTLINYYPKFDVKFLGTDVVVPVTKFFGNGQDVVIDPVSNIAGEIVSVEPLCPPNVTCIVDGTVLTVRFTLPSPCYDLQLSQPVVNEYGVDIAATQVPNTLEMVCAAMTVEKEEKITLINVYPPFMLNFLGTDISEEITTYTAGFPIYFP